MDQWQVFYLQPTCNLEGWKTVGQHLNAALQTILTPWTTTMTALESVSISNSDEVGIVLAGFSPAHKTTLLIVVCIGQFLDTFSNSALFSAIPPICVELGISNSNSVWLQSGYQLTFAGLLLMVKIFVTFVFLLTRQFFRAAVSVICTTQVSLMYLNRQIKTERFVL